ncbi:hypothetical protein ElyMa_002364900 [Elysia marginata]|uniref:Uncharacterized protein n=1 Tax=Elysia marginata TaxID=1093978 RepID=A0AAV4GA23_9GAST|nr:hypothetical protein ElyMa_002364900 [Elysia marginata]
MVFKSALLVCRPCSLPEIRNKRRSKSLMRIVLDSHHNKGLPQVAPQGEGHTAARRALKSTKKFRAPSVPPSAGQAASETHKDQGPSRVGVSAEKTGSSGTLVDQAHNEQPQRPTRQKKQSDSQGSQRKEHAHSASSGQTAERKHVLAEMNTPCETTTNAVTSAASGIPKARSSKRRPAPLPTQAPQISTVNVPVKTELQQASSDNSSSLQDSNHQGTSQTSMPTQVAERSARPDLALHTSRVRDSASDNEAPPLPSTAPPPLPSSPPPPLVAAANPLSTPGQLDSAEEISIEYTVAVNLSSSEFISGVERAPSSSSHQHTLESNTDTMFGDRKEKNTGSTDVTTVGTMEQQKISRQVAALENNNNETKTNTGLEDGDSLDSDISTDDESNENTKGGTYDFFSPGDSGRLSWSLTSSADDDLTNFSNNENGVVLISSTGNYSKMAPNSATQGDSDTPPPQPSYTLQTSSPSTRNIKPVLKNTVTDSVTASSSVMVLSTPKHNILELDTDTFEPIASESSSTQRPPSPVHKPPSLTLKTPKSPLQTPKPPLQTQKPPSPTQKPPSPLHIQPSPPTAAPSAPSATQMNREHHDLLASTAALIKSQKSATPRDVSPQKSQGPQSPTRASPVNEKVVKSGGLALFSPRLGADHDADILKLTKENELVAKAMHFAEMTQPKSPTFVVRKAHQDGDDQSQPVESNDLKKHQAKSPTFVNGCSRLLIKDIILITFFFDLLSKWPICFPTSAQTCCFTLSSNTNISSNNTNINSNNNNINSSNITYINSSNNTNINSNNNTNINSSNNTNINSNNSTNISSNNNNINSSNNTNINSNKNANINSSNNTNISNNTIINNSNNNIININ